MSVRSRYNRSALPPPRSRNVLTWVTTTFGGPILLASLIMTGAKLGSLFHHHAHANPKSQEIRLAVRDNTGGETVHKGTENIHVALDSLRAPQKKKNDPPRKHSGKQDKPAHSSHPAAASLSEKHKESGNPDHAVLKGKIKKLTDEDPIPYELLIRLVQSESGYNTRAVSVAGAVGMLQLMPKTLLELLYRHKDLLPAPHSKTAAAVEMYKKNQKAWEKDPENIAPVYGYRVRKGYSEKTVMNLARNPDVSIILGREYIRMLSDELQNNLQENLGGLLGTIETKYSAATMKNYAARVKSMRHHLNRPLNYADIKAGYVFGPKGGPKFLTAYADPGKHGHRALDYASKSTVSSNPGLFYADPETRQTPLSVVQVYKKFTKMMGKDPLPRDLSRPETDGTATAEEKTPPSPHL